MHKSQSLLPRLRTSFGGAVSSRGSSAGRRFSLQYPLLALCGMLLLGGYVTLSGYAQQSSAGNGSSNGKAATKSSGSSGFEPLSLAVAALQSKAAAAAAKAANAALLKQQQELAGAGSVEAIQQLQQGAEMMAAGVDSMGSMTRTLNEQGFLAFDSQRNASLTGAAAGVSFFDANTDIKNSYDAMQRRPAVHGHVTKAGVTDLKCWFGNYSDTRLDSFISWRVNRAKAGGVGPATGPDGYTCPAADHPRMPFPGCHVFVNHKYKYIYIRSPKAASTSIVNVLGECNNKATRGHNSSSCMVLHFYWNSTELSTEYLQKMWKDYFVFGFVRNPWRRAYSLYKYLHSNGCMSDDKLRDPDCKVPWSSFCTDPWSAGEQLHDKGCIKRSKSYLYFHMEDQLHCMRTAGGEWAVDFIGRVDEPNEDWAEVLRTLNARRDPDVPELPIADLEQKNVRAGNVRNPYAKPGAEQCFDAVSRLYACDVQHYGFASLSRGTQ